MQEAEKSSKELENIKELKSPETISEKNLNPQKNKDKEKLHKGLDTGSRRQYSVIILTLPRKQRKSDGVN